MIHVKVVSRKGGGYLFESEGSIAWDPIASPEDARELDVLVLYDDNAPPESLIGVWIGPDNSNNFVFDVNEYDVYVLGEDGKTIDKIP